MQCLIMQSCQTTPDNAVYLPAKFFPLQIVAWPQVFVSAREISDPNKTESETTLLSPVFAFPCVRNPGGHLHVNALKVECHDPSIPSLNTGCVKMLLSNLKIIFGATQGGRENTTALQMVGWCLSCGEEALNPISNIPS